MIRATLLADGTSDRVLLPIVRWVLGQATPRPFELEWADLTFVAANPRTLERRVAAAIALFPCDVLFVHRDAESQDPELRYGEIEQALPSAHPSCVPIVPVRMQEAWLLHDEGALRRAVGRPSGREPLGLPELSRVERIADPKQALHDAIRYASGAAGRRARKLKPSKVAHLLASQVHDWAPLRTLSAFRRFETDTRSAVRALPG